MPAANSPNPRNALALLGVFAFALGVRALGFEQVFTDEGVVFAPADATDHVRRAFYTFANFPALLLRDPYLNFPGGANVSWPPLFDFLVGGAARLVASDQAGFEKVAAWASRVFGALTVVPIYFIARRVTSPGVGLFAGLIFSLFPICVSYGRVGNPDPRTAIALVGACLLLLCTHLARPDLSDRKILLLSPLMMLARLSMILIWHGSLLYIAFFEVTILLIAAITRVNAVTKACALSAIFTAVVLSPIVEEFLPVPIGGAYSSVALSRLHVLVMLGTSFVAFCHWVLNRQRPESGFALRLLTLGAASLVFIASLLAFDATRSGLLPGLQFLAMPDVASLERLPLLPFLGRDPTQSPQQLWAGFAYLLPLAPVAFPFFVSDSQNRPSAWVLTGWTAGFVVLAIAQRRYGNDLAPAAAVAFAIGLAALPREILRRLDVQSPRTRGVAALVSVLLALGLFSSTLRRYEVPRFQSGLAALRGTAPMPAVGSDLLSSDVAHFTRKVRAATPATEGFLDQRRNPEYGIIASANLGHALHYYARRATATDSVRSNIEHGNGARSAAFFRAKREFDAIAIANHLNGRYVVTADTDSAGTVAGRLHQRDGRAGDQGPRLEHFRLVTESSPGRAGFGRIDDQQIQPLVEDSNVAYKLFEIVKGAVLEVETTPQTRVRVSLTIDTPSGRSFLYLASADAGDDGIARLRVPYSTASETPIHAEGPYRISAGTRLSRVHVNEVDVRDGLTVAVGMAGGSIGFF